MSRICDKYLPSLFVLVGVVFIGDALCNPQKNLDAALAGKPRERRAASVSASM